MATQSEIRTASDRLLDSLESNSEFIQREFRRVLRNYVNEIQWIVSQPQTQQGQLRLSDIQSVSEDLGRILQQSGLDDLTEDHLLRLGALVDDVGEYYQVFDKRRAVAGISPNTLSTLLEYEESRFLEAVDNRLVVPFRNALLGSSLLTRDQRSIEEEVGSLIQQYQIETANGRAFTDNQVETLVYDSMQTFQQAVKTSVADDIGFNIYQYLGPLDGKTRRACKAMLSINRHGVPGVLYKDEITVALDPTLDRDPLLAGGGFNCRHFWQPIDEESAIGLGFKPRGN